MASLRNIDWWMCRLDPVEFVRERLGIEPDAVQAEWLRRSVHRGILNCSRQWGKSTLAAAKAVYHAANHAGSLVLVVSPSERQSGELVGKAERFVRRLGQEVKRDRFNSASVVLPNESRIIGIPSKEDTVRGYSAVSLLLVDEAARVSDELYEAVKPMLAATDGDLWLMSTPRGKRGFFWKVWNEGGAEWVKTAVPATKCARISGKFLEGERREMAERKFRQEYLCEFVEAEDAVFREEWLEGLISDEVKPLWLGF
jgi:hypothetical protein